MTCTRLGIYQQNYDFELPGTTGSIPYFVVLEVYTSVIELHVHGFYICNLRNLLNKVY